MVWYYVKHGKQQGPVDEAEFGNLARTGGIGSADLVWTADFGAEWRPAHSLPWLVFSQDATPVTLLPPNLPRSASEFAYTKFRSVTTNRDLEEAARASLRGSWGTAIGVAVVWGFYSVVIGLLSRVLELWYSLVVGLLNFLLSGAISLGLSLFWLSMSRTGNGTFVQSLSGFRRFGTALGTRLLVALIPSLWFLLVIAPGVILYFLYAGMDLVDPFANPLLTLLGGVLVLAACFVSESASLSYSQAFNCLADNPAMSAVEAIGRSKIIMAGNRWKCFELGFRIGVWTVLCVPTLGIGLLWLVPFAGVSYAKFYDDLHPI